MSSIESRLQGKEGVIEIATALEGLKESGNYGEIVTWSEAEGLPWCAGFVTKVFDEAGYEAIFEGCSGRLSVEAVMKHGESLGVSKEVEDTPPPVGSVISFDGRGHIGIITKVNEDGSFDITQGNTTDSVKTVSYTMDDFRSGHLDTNYMDANEMSSFLDTKGVNNALGEGGADLASTNLPSQQQLGEELGKSGNISDVFEKHSSQDFGQEGQEPSFFDFLLMAALMTFAGKDDMIPSHEDFIANPRTTVDDAFAKASEGNLEVDATRESDIGTLPPPEASSRAEQTQQDRTQQAGQWL